MEDRLIEQSHSKEIEAISSALRGCAAQGGIDRELVNTLLEHSSTLLRIARLYDLALIKAAEAEQFSVAYRKGYRAGRMHSGWVNPYPFGEDEAHSDWEAGYERAALDAVQGGQP